MRQIKFRAWDEKTKTLWQDCIWMFAESGIFRMRQAGQDAQAFPMEVVEQFTGLKDKNGKDIYEGDILAIPDESRGTFAGSHDEPPEPFNHLEPVTYALGGFRAKKMTMEQLLDEYDLPTVIGNIHEDPDLLTPTP